MKISSVLLMSVFLHAGAVGTYSQGARVTIDVEQVTLAEVLDEMEHQTNYLFFYNKKNVNVNKSVNVRMKNAPVSKVLDETLDGDVAYTMVNDHIILSKRNDGTMAAILQQAKRVTGTVTDVGGEAIAGANIIEKGTTNGILTDAEGNFSLSVSDNAVLQVSYLGYVTQEVQLRGIVDRPLLIKLSEDTQLLEEVVVVGYGTQKKANLTGAVSTVSLPEMEKRTVAQTSLALAGLVPGVVVTQRSGKPGGDGGVISVRGKTTLGNNDVLVLVDGVESNINIIDPKSIESISVLKDAASAAIYGSRAANGVILITTKRAEDGKAYISYSGYVAKGRPTNVPKYVGAVDFMKYISIAKRAVGMTPEYSEEYIREYEDGISRNDPNYPDVDWFDATTTNNGLINSHFVTVSLGTKEIKSLAQVGYLSQNGITENTDYKRYTLRSNTDFKVSEKIEIRSDLALTYTDAREPAKLGTGYNWVGRIPANQAAYLADGRYGPGWQG
ncbi:MAG: SusC/RagA family TonB-linked outer membrane protein, partial [Bacteroidales bacterium]|nr:SusC/RagA family TonB-linked outer membrane protein [Bacteroidales bacterium]